MAEHRASKRAQAEGRNAETPLEKTRAFREGRLTTVLHVDGKPVKILLKEQAGDV